MEALFVSHEQRKLSLLGGLNGTCGVKKLAGLIQAFSNEIIAYPPN